MQFKNSAERYGAIAQLLHWTIVALIITQFTLAELAEDAGSRLEQAKILTTHKSVGMTIFMLAVLRLLWRAINQVPKAPTTMPRWQQISASIVHWLLYALILCTPLAGLLMSQAKNFPVSWFGQFTFPNLVAPNEDLFKQMKELHEALASGIFFIAIVHLLAALKHHFIDKDNVLRRMLPMKLK